MDRNAALEVCALPLATTTDLEPKASQHHGPALAMLLADVFALYLRTKNVHWNMSGPRFRDCYQMLD